MGHSRCGGWPTTDDLPLQEIWLGKASMWACFEGGQQNWRKQVLRLLLIVLQCGVLKACLWRVDISRSIPISDEFREVMILPLDLNEQRKRGNPKNNKYRSSVELPKWKHKCIKCGQEGHYQKKCRQNMPETSQEEPITASQPWYQKVTITVTIICHSDVFC